MSPKRSTRPRLLVPEVVQTSAMDCGPATLKCLLEGFGISASYGRLREACQTDVDGTSIDTIEEIAVQLGLEAEQNMVPLDHLLLPEAQALPAIVVVRHPNGLTHFVVAWSRHGPFVQLMDPAIGRRLISHSRFLEEVYSHQFPVPSAQWREWAGSENFLAPLKRRLADVGTRKETIARLVATALADPGWRTIADLDAATRMVASIIRSGGLARGQQATRVLESFFEQARALAPGEKPSIPTGFWIAQPGTPGPEGEEQVLMRGAVLVRILGRREASPSSPAENEDGLVSGSSVSAAPAPEPGWGRLVPASCEPVISAGDEPSPPRFRGAKRVKMSGSSLPRGFGSLSLQELCFAQNIPQQLNRGWKHNARSGESAAPSFRSAPCRSRGPRAARTNLPATHAARRSYRMCAYRPQIRRKHPRHCRRGPRPGQKSQRDPLSALRVCGTRQHYPG